MTVQGPVSGGLRVGLTGAGVRGRAAGQVAVDQGHRLLGAEADWQQVRTKIGM